jgi:hypothetical protein
MAKAKKSRKIRKRRPGDALDWQERHSPTVEIAVDDPEGTRKTRRNLTRCRQSEAWRHNKLDGMQRDAWTEMAKAYQIRTAGSRPARSSYGPRVGGAAPESIALEQTWREWCTAAVDRRIMVSAVVDCLIEPKTLAEIERDHRMRRGEAMDQFISALDLWSELRGWMRGHRMHAGPHLVPEHVT